MTFEDDCRIVYERIQEGLIPFESFLGFIEEAKSMAYIDGVIRGAAPHGPTVKETIGD